MLTEVADEEGLGGAGSPFSVFDVVVLVDIQAVSLSTLMES